MLHSLHIRNYVLIDSLDVSFPEGLIVISGPTGAGKSILVGALSLLGGKKADASVIAPGGESCVVEGEFVVRDPSLEQLCREEDIDYCDGEIIVRRTVSPSGRSRCFVNDCPVAAPVLEKMSKLLFDIHSQHDTLLLTDGRYQLDVLDHFCKGAEPLRRKCAAAYASVRDARSGLSALEQEIARAQGASEADKEDFARLSKAGIQEGEIAALEEEQFTLSHQEQIKELLSACLTDFDPGDGASAGLSATLSSLQKNLEHLGRLLPPLSSLAERVNSTRIELKDIEDEIRDADSRFDASPQRLQWVDDRLALLYGLLKRYSCGNEADLIRRRDALRCTDDALEDLQTEAASLRNTLLKYQTELDNIAAALHRERSEAIPDFCSKVLENLSYMELDKASFTVELSPADVSPSGADSVQMLFSATSSRPMPVARCASGGELSRIMLALKKVMSTCMNLPTMIFDEIDTGVSGSVADRMGSVISSMGAGAQVFAITHLPQVAAKGSAHFMVSKTVDGGRGVSSIKRLSDDERILEVARMLSGTSLSEEAVANAKSLLGCK